MTSSRLYSRTVTEARIPPERRIYVNRNLRMDSIRAIGFDLDHTLAHYRGPAVEELAYRLTQVRLVERFGYPAALLEVPYEREFVIRGLVVDKRRGHLLKMDYHNYVARAYHGRRLLSTEERKAAYRTGRVRTGSDGYVSVDTLFHFPEVFLFATLVGMREDKRVKRSIGCRKIYSDVREAIDSVHGDGTLKAEILGNLDRYIRKDQRLGRTLEVFRGAGKKIFLLTNSEYYYSAALLGHLLGNGTDWTAFFDLIVVDAGKPAYFADLERLPSEPREGDPEGVMHGGNARLLEKTLGFAGDQIIYFGDHTYGDILRSKKTLGWRTAMVVEELEEELAVTRRLQPQLEELNHWTALRGVLEADLSEIRRRQLQLERRGQAPAGNASERGDHRRQLDILNDRADELDAEIANVHAMAKELGDAVYRTYNPYWGSLFREGRETSRFGHQVKDFACLYMTRVSNLLNYHPQHYFRSAEERMPHELG